MKTTGVAGIYKILNLKTGKFYVGSAVCLASRKGSHFRNLRLNQHHSIKLQRSFNKHGIENFNFIVLELITDKTKLIEREQFYINTFNPFYNICKIAGNTLGIRRTKKQKLHLSKVKSGIPAHNRKETYQLDLKGNIIELFSSTKHAMIKTGIDQGSIATVCRHQQHSSGGFVWCYKKEIDNGKITIEQLITNFQNSLRFLSNQNQNSKFLKNVA